MLNVGAHLLLSLQSLLNVGVGQLLEFLLLSHRLRALFIEALLLLQILLQRFVALRELLEVLVLLVGHRVLQLPVLVAELLHDRDHALLFLAVVLAALLERGHNGPLLRLARLFPFNSYVQVYDLFVQNFDFSLLLFRCVLALHKLLHQGLVGLLRLLQAAGQLLDF